MATRSKEPAEENEDSEVVADEAAPPPSNVSNQAGPATRSPVAEARRIDRTTKWSVDRLDERERRYSFVAAGAAAAFGVIIYIVQSQNAHFRLAKNQLTPQTTLIVGLVSAALLIGATLIGRRALVGFVALFAGIAFTNSFFPASLPFLAFAFWLLWHSYKVQKQASIDMRAARAQAAASPAAPSTRSPGRTASKSGTKGPAKPQGNKRYTPKTPPRPAPKPTRKERKAASSAD